MEVDLFDLKPRKPRKILLSAVSKAVVNLAREGSGLVGQPGREMLTGAVQLSKLSEGLSKLEADKYGYDQVLPEGYKGQNNKVLIKPEETKTNPN